MERIQGDIGCALLECINPYIGKYVARWDKQIETTQEEVDNPIEYATYYEHIFSHQPTLAEIQEVVYNQINTDTQEEIVCGFKWHGATVWLSSENQFNYKAAYDLALQTSGKSLPLTVKLGAEVNPSYVTFSTIAEIEAFYIGAMTHINDCLRRCWEKKDKIDWSPYETLLKE